MPPEPLAVRDDRSSHDRPPEREAKKPRPNQIPGLGCGIQGGVGSIATSIAGEVPALTIVDHALVSPPKLTRRRVENTGVVDPAVGITRRAAMMPCGSERRRGKGHNSR